VLDYFPQFVKMTSERPKSTEGYELVDENGVLERLRIRTSLDDVRSPYFWRSLVAELLGTMLLVFIGVGSCIPPTSVVQIALCFGLAVATIVWAIAHVSGGHINPAVTLAMLITRRISLVRGGLYIVFQLLGALAGAGLIYAVVPRELNGTQVGAFGATVPHTNVMPVLAFLIEAIITFVLVFVVFATVDPKRDDLNGSGPLAIGLSVTLCHLAAVPLTGSSMNPARSFGPAIVKSVYPDHWVSWVGPILGSVMAALLYENVFAANASLTRSRAYLLASKYDGSEFVSMKNAEKIGVVEKKVEEKEEEHIALEIKE